MRQAFKEYLDVNNYLILLYTFNYLRKQLQIKHKWMNQVWIMIVQGIVIDSKRLSNVTVSPYTHFIIIISLPSLMVAIWKFIGGEVLCCG